MIDQLLFYQDKDKTDVQENQPHICEYSQQLQSAEQKLFDLTETNLVSQQAKDSLIKQLLEQAAETKSVNQELHL